MNQSNSSKQVLLSVIGVAILVVAVVGVSFAFFNYTRTGATNTVRTGLIYFDTTESKVNVDNLFPVSKTTALSRSSTTNGEVFVSTITVNGYTTYANGVDYVVTAEDVNFNTTATGTNIKLPISVNVSASSSLGPTAPVDAYKFSLDVNDQNKIAASALNPAYATGNSNSVTVINYEVNPAAYVAADPANSVTEQLNNEFTDLRSGAILAKGHIAYDANASSTNKTTGTITIRAYIDNTKVAISDTYPSGNVDTNNDEVVDYTNGTTDAWVAGRTVLTTAQWNSLNSSGASFKIKVVANEGAGPAVVNPYA